MGASTSSAARSRVTADTLLATLTACETLAANITASVPSLASLTAELVARKHASLHRALALQTSVRSALLSRKARLLWYANCAARKHRKVAVAAAETLVVSSEQLCVWSGVVCRDGQASWIDADASTAHSRPWSCVLATLPLFDASPRVLPPLLVVSSTVASPVCDAGSCGEVGSVVSVQGLCVYSATGPGLKWFNPHWSGHNEFSVVLVQSDGSVPAWLTSRDVAVTVMPVGGAPANAESTAVTVVIPGALTTVFGAGTANCAIMDSGCSGALTASVQVLSDSVVEVALCLTVCGVPVADAGKGSCCEWSVRVARSRWSGRECATAGRYVRTLTVMEGYKIGMAVSADEKWLVVGSFVGTLAVYSLPGGRRVRTFGGRGDGPLQFRYLCRLCFTPNGNVIVADGNNARLQEVTLKGKFVRFIGCGEFGKATPNAVDVHDDTIAVGCYLGTHDDARVVLFNLSTGAVISRFGEVGSAPGQLSAFCTGIRFTPDGSHVILADRDGPRLHVFTTTGTFVRALDVGATSPGVCFADVVLSKLGECVAIDHCSKRVCVLSADGSEIVRSWVGDGLTSTSHGAKPFLFETLSSSGKHLYVMDYELGVVHVFE